MLERLFKLKQNGTTVRTEIVAGVATFMTMAYIIFVQPAVLSQAGMDFGAVMVATCIASAAATFVMALHRGDLLFPDRQNDRRRLPAQRR